MTSVQFGHRESYNNITDPRLARLLMKTGFEILPAPMHIITTKTQHPL